MVLLVFVLIEDEGLFEKSMAVMLASISLIGTYTGSEFPSSSCVGLANSTGLERRGRDRDLGVVGVCLR